MASIYGRINNSNKNQFTFAYVYDNKTQMDSNCSTDGYRVGQYVLVDYDTTIDRLLRVYINPADNLLYLSSQYETLTRVSKSDVKDTGIVFTADDAIEGVYTNIKYYKITYSEEETSVGFIYSEVTEDDFGYGINFNTDKSTEEAKSGATLTNFKGYDSTVWQKVSNNNVISYVNIANLNSVVPTFDIAADAPSLRPITPHFDINSTDVYYKMHQQAPWGFRVKTADDDNPGEKDIKIVDESYTYDPTTGESVPYVSDERQGAIYYNEDGFDYATRSEIDGTNKITIKPTGYSGNTYSHKTSEGKEYPDIMEMAINLPGIGDAVSKMWDLIYGDVSLTGDENRWTDINWDDNDNTENPLRLKLVTTKDNKLGYENKQINTLAGCINSAHDLLGMIITPYSDDAVINPENNNAKHSDSAVLDSDFDHIYYYNGKYYKLGIDYDYTTYEGTTNPIKDGENYIPITFINDEESLVYSYSDNAYWNVDKATATKIIPYYYITPTEVTDIQPQYVKDTYYYLEDNNYKLEDSITAEGAHDELYSLKVSTDNTPLIVSYKEIGTGTGTSTVKQYAYYYKQKSTDPGFIPVTALGGYDEGVYVPQHPNTSYTYYKCDLTPTGGTQIVVDPTTGEIKSIDVYTITYTEVSNPVNITTTPIYDLDSSGNYIRLTTDEIESYTEATKTYYTLTPTTILKSKMYTPSTYYTLDGNNYILSTKDYDENNKPYYTITDKEVNLYVPKYYYIKTDYGYERSDTEYDNTQNYYKAIKYYIIKDTNEKYKNLPVEWRGTKDTIPTGLTLATREQYYRWYELEGFARNLNTLHGELLTTRNMLDGYNQDNREDDNVTGAINKLNDLINNIVAVESDTFMIVDECGKLVSTPYTTEQKYKYKNIGIGIESMEESAEDQYIVVDINTDYTNPQINIVHNTHSVDDTTTIADKNEALTIIPTGYDAFGLNNSTGDTLDLYTPIVDNMGHIVGNNKETVTLPYGYKTFQDSETTAGTSIASSTQDTMTLKGDTWVKPTVTEDKITISHIGPAEVTHTTVSGVTPKFGDTFSITDLDFDSKGHKANSGTHTVTIPNTIADYKKPTTSGGALTATDTLNSAFGKLEYKIDQEISDRAKAIDDLDVTGASGISAGNTISSWSEADGKVSISTQAISITSSQISDLASTYSSTGKVAITGTAVASALSSYLTSEDASKTYQPKGDYESADSTIVKTGTTFSYKAKGASSASNATLQDIINSLTERLEALEK